MEAAAKRLWPEGADLQPRNLVLAGFMGAGKSVVGRELAAQAGLRFVDLDTEIASRAGQSIAEIFQAEGEEGFRQRETAAIAALAGIQGAVIASGGGAVASDRNRALLHSLGPVIHLDVSAALLWRRAAGGDRPLAANRQAFFTLLDARRPLYRALPYQLSVGQDAPRDVARRIAGRFLAPGRTVRVELADRSYDIAIAGGGLCGLGEAMAATMRPGRCLLVSHEAVWRRYGEVVAGSLEAAGWQAAIAIVPPGEPSKSISRASSLYQALAARELERNDPVVALGGGVVGDLAGFVAATYLRGVPFVQVPTTLLAQIDSSVGGKVAVNLPAGKNLVGAFYQPRLVVADPLTLQSLSEREFRSGLAELIKYGAIVDGQLFETLERDLDRVLDRQAGVLVPLIARACELKAQIVSADEREAGLRRILNFGHTLGHAIEAVAGYGQVRHGEAVAVGMVFAARLGQAEGLCAQEVVDRLEDLLSRAGLPTRTDLPAEALLTAMQHDKKVQDGALTWILPERLGAVRAVGEIGRSRLLALLAGTGESSRPL